MSDNNKIESKKSYPLWAVRILYVVVSLFVLVEIASFIDYVPYLIYNASYTSYAAYAIFVIALAAQFPYVFLNRLGKIKENVMYLVALVMMVVTKLPDVITNINNPFGEYYSSSLQFHYIPIILSILEIAVTITFYFLIKNLNKGREAVDGSEENSVFKKAVKVVKENRM